MAKVTLVGEGEIIKSFNERAFLDDSSNISYDISECENGIMKEN